MMLEILRQLHDDFSDEIPIEILEGKGDFKVRRNWWQQVVLSLQFLGSQVKMPLELWEEVDDFVGHYTSDAFKGPPLTTEEDIGKANSLLAKVLAETSNVP